MITLSQNFTSLGFYVVGSADPPTPSPIGGIRGEGGEFILGEDALTDNAILGEGGETIKPEG